MADLRELYQEVLLEHSKTPRNYRKLEAANRSAEGFNPLCGDHFNLYLRMEGNRIAEIAFEGSGCALSKASASMMTSILKGKTVAEAEALFSRFHQMVTGHDGNNELGKLSVFSGVCEFPVRVKGVSLVWHTLMAALKGEQQPVSTE